MQVAGQFFEHLNRLTTAINEVKNIVETEMYGMDPGDTLVVPRLLLPLRIEFPVQALQ